MLPNVCVTGDTAEVYSNGTAGSQITCNVGFIGKWVPDSSGRCQELIFFWQWFQNRTGLMLLELPLPLHTRTHTLSLSHTHTLRVIMTNVLL